MLLIKPRSRVRERWDVNVVRTSYHYYCDFDETHVELSVRWNHYAHTPHTYVARTDYKLGFHLSSVFCHSMCPLMESSKCWFRRKVGIISYLFAIGIGTNMTADDIVKWLDGNVLLIFRDCFHCAIAWNTANYTCVTVLIHTWDDCLMFRIHVVDLSVDIGEIIIKFDPTILKAAGSRHIHTRI